MLDRSRFPRSDALVVAVGHRDSDAEDETGSRFHDPQVDGADFLWFENYEAMYGTFTPHAVELLETIRARMPGSIRETARHVDRNVSNVHAELTELARLGVIDLVEENGAKRPRFPYDLLVLEPPLAAEPADATPQ